MILEEVVKELDIDLEPALDRVVNNRSLYIHLLKVFIDDGYMKPARLAMTNRDFDAILVNVHSMKGSAASLGLIEMSEVCYHLVTAIRQQEYERTEELFAKVEEEYARVKAVLLKLEE